MRPDRLFDSGTPHERSSLAWERTAFSGIAMVVGISTTAATGLATVLAIVAMMSR